MDNIPQPGTETDSCSACDCLLLPHRTDGSSWCPALLCCTTPRRSLPDNWVVVDSCKWNLPSQAAWKLFVLDAKQWQCAVRAKYFSLFLFHCSIRHQTQSECKGTYQAVWIDQALVYKIRQFLWKEKIQQNLTSHYYDSNDSAKSVKSVKYSDKNSTLDILTFGRFSSCKDLILSWGQCRPHRTHLKVPIEKSKIIFAFQTCDLFA